MAGANVSVAEEKIINFAKDQSKLLLSVPENTMLMPREALAKLSDSLGRMKKRNLCYNSNCSSRCEELTEAPQYAMIYFGLMSHRPIQICDKCLKKAKEFHELSKKIVKTQGNLFSLKIEQPTNTVIDLESDEKGVLSEAFRTPSSSDHFGQLFSVSENVINKEISQVLSKLNLHEQIKKCAETVGAEITSLGNDMKCLQKKFEDLQDTVSSTYQKYLAVTAPPKVLVESNDIFYPELNINHKATNVRDPEPVAFETAGTIEKLLVPENCPIPRKFVNHVCEPACAFKYIEEDFRNINPLATPFYLGWAREFSPDGRGVSIVGYITPCGRRLVTYDDILDYNRMALTDIPIEFFSLDLRINCLSVFKPHRKIVELKDLSYGKEWTAVECINSINFDEPVSINYATHRVLTDCVRFDDGFLACCDCTDDCKDKTNCACWQLTMSGVSFKTPTGKGNLPVVGYENRHLSSLVDSGIYECNHNCKCNARACLNRVVQGKVKWPIQVFKTKLKGWGVRALHDMPKGSFLCVYTGRISTDEEGNKQGLIYGDEYIADLDYIEVMENMKEGYESECLYSSSESDDEKSETQITKKTSKKTANKFEAKYGPDLPVARKSTSGRAFQTVKECRNGSGSTKSCKINGDEMFVIPMEHIRCQYKCEFSKIVTANLSKPVRYREYFGNEGPFNVDGKRTGNFGRFLNHSCDPNVFIQNVFVDTHDLRFPWVAFFTSKNVKAGTELCWDYRYEKDSVPGKTLFCYCGSKNCRKRLL